MSNILLIIVENASIRVLLSAIPWKSGDSSLLDQLANTNPGFAIALHLVIFIGNL